MLSEPLPAAKRPAISSNTAAANGTTRTTKTTSSVDGTATITITTTATTISSLGQDQLLEIFLRLPNLPALIRAALTCRSWIDAVRTCPSFRRLFRELHPAPPLIGLFLDIDGAATPSFVPLRRSDPDVTAAVRRGDFLLTSLPVNDDAYESWGITDCRGGYVLLWNKIDRPSVVAAVNPMTWAVDIIRVPRDVRAGRSGRRREFAFLGFHLLYHSDEENPSSFRVVCVCADKERVRAAVFSSATRDWTIHPWVHVGGDNSLKSSAGMLVNGSVYWPFHGEGRMIRINTATMDITTMDLPSEVTVKGHNFRAGETKDGELCIVYASDDFLLHIWIRSLDDDDGIDEVWVLHKMISLSEEIDEISRYCDSDWPANIEVVQVRSGYVYLSATHMALAGITRCWFFSLSLETMELELLVEGSFGRCACPYIVAWPPCLVGDDGSIGHQVEGSH